MNQPDDLAPLGAAEIRIGEDWDLSGYFRQRFLDMAHRRDCRFFTMRYGVTEPADHLDALLSAIKAFDGGVRLLAEGHLSGAGPFNLSVGILRLFVSPSGAIIFLRLDADGDFTLHAAADTGAEILEIEGIVARTCPPSRPVENPAGVRVNFWRSSRHGATYITRVIQAPSWEEIRGNYLHIPDLSTLDELMAGHVPTDGAILVWHGPPGTGKTYAIRALLRAWKTHNLCYILDPDILFGGEMDYLATIFFGGGDATLCGDGQMRESEEAPDMCRVLIIEDAGELLGVDAKEKVGQALSRLFNITDGLPGQGLNLKVLITTNDELGRLHPALVRPGRCAGVHGFPAMKGTEAARWVKSRPPAELARMDRLPTGADFERSWTLAELYHLVHGRGRPSPRPATVTSVGFRRARKGLF